MSESIPEGWEIKKLGEIGRFSTSSVDKKVNTNEKTVNLLNYMDIYNNSTLDNQYSFQLVTANQKQISSSNVLSGDIFFTPSSENPDDIGHSAVFVGDIKNLVHSYHTIRYRTYSSEEFEEAFKAYAFKSNETYLYFRKMAQGSTRFTLSLPAFEELQILIPTIPEQKKIASILTSVDEVIVKTQSQIEKLQDLKKGMVNELLTKGIGHTEFKDSELGRIPKSWEVALLSDHASRVLGKNDIGNTNVLTASAIDGLINQKKYFNKSVSSSDISHYTLLRRGDFAYNKSYSNGYPVGVVRQLEKYDLGVLSPLYICFSITSNECDKTYLSYYFNSYIFERELNLVVQEGARAHGLLNIPVNDFFDRKLLIPNLPEQKIIVSILNSIDNQIDQKKQKLNKKQSLKKSLMQCLLTGKVRVKVN